MGNGKTHVRQMVLSPGMVEALRRVQEGCARGEGHDLVEFPAEERRSLPSARERLLQLASEARAAVNGVTHPSLAVKRITDPGNVVYQVCHSLGTHSLSTIRHSCTDALDTVFLIIRHPSAPLS